MCGVWWIPDELCLAQLPRCLQPIRQIRLLYTFGITIVCELTNSNFKLHLYQIHTAYCLDFCLIPFLRLDPPLIHLGMMAVRQRETVSVRQFRKHVIVPFIAALLVILKRNYALFNLRFTPSQRQSAHTDAAGASKPQKTTASMHFLHIARCKCYRLLI